MRLDKVSVISGRRILPNDELGTVFLAELNIFRHSVELEFGNLRTLICVFVKRVADFIAKRILCKSLDEFILNRFMDVNSSRGTTDLSLIIEPRSVNFDIKARDTFHDETI